MAGEAAMWRTLSHLYLTVAICGVVVPAVTAVGALSGLTESLFAMLAVGGVSLVVCSGFVFLLHGHPRDIGTDQTEFAGP